MSTVERVNHPSHYDGNTSLECIDCMQVALGREATLNFCLCNAFKYLWRYKNKNGAEDIEKAKWYLDYVDNSIKHDYSEPLSDNIQIMYHRLRGLYDSIVRNIKDRGLS